MTVPTRGIASAAVPPSRIEPGGVRVLLVESSLRDNGGLRVSLEHARRWTGAGRSVLVAVLQHATDGPLAAPDPAVHVRALTAPGTRFRTAWAPAIARLRSAARGFDVVVCGSEVGFGLLVGFAAARLARRPFAVLVQAHLDDAIATWVPARLQRLTRWVHARADAAVCVAPDLVEPVVANGLPRERAHVVTNGVDVRTIRERAGLPPADAEPAERRARSATGLPVVVANGRLSPQKDYELLIRACVAVRAAGVAHRLVILGDGPSRGQLEALIDRLGAQDMVELAGFAANPFPHLAAADMFVLSSRTEGMPLTVLEALAVGAPVVATRCGAGTEMLLDGGRYGQLVTTGSVDELAAAIEQHLRDPRWLSAVARRGPARALEFDTSRSAAALMDVLSGLRRRPLLRRPFRRG